MIEQNEGCNGKGDTRKSKQKGMCDFDHLPNNAKKSNLLGAATNYELFHILTFIKHSVNSDQESSIVTILFIKTG